MSTEERANDSLDKALALLANKNRRRIVRLLLEERSQPVTTTWVSGSLGIKLNLASKHLHRLLDSGLIKRFGHAHYAIWMIDREKLAQVRNELNALLERPADD